MIAVKVEQLFLSNMGFAVLLKSQEDERSLPIMIGAAEAQAIALYMNQVEVPRPLTHDLFKNVMDQLNCRIKRTEVCGLKAGTFYARLILTHGGNDVDLDSRPSDAIALALRFGAPIYVDETVMSEAGRVFSAEEMAARPSTSPPPAKSAGKPRKRLTRQQKLELEMQRAVAEERYEDCARLRDEIAQLKRTADQTDA